MGQKRLTYFFLPVMPWFKVHTAIFNFSVPSFLHCTALRGKMSRPNKVSGASDEVSQHLDFVMNTEETRLSSFEDWPFDEDCNCIPSKMAAAGFYHCPTAQEPDLVRCFTCYKELDGWEPTDDPLLEHKSHAPKCAFITKKKAEKDMTMAEYFKLEAVRQSNRLMSHVESRLKEFTYEAQKTREQIEKLKY